MLIGQRRVANACGPKRKTRSSGCRFSFPVAFNWACDLVRSTLRQLAYLVVAGIIAGAVVLFGPVEGNGLLVRVLIGLGIISVGVALAFFRKDGLTAEQWIATQIKFW